MKQTKKRYFDTFDALRFFAFSCVFLGHIPALSIPFLDIFQHSAGLGVKFFFTLSGFLITYLILEEKERTNKLNLGNFFFRRILKIWPLYYLMILFAFATPFLLQLFHLPSSQQGYEPNWLMSVFFLENYKMIYEQQLPNVSPLSVMWSLCVEEHFYIIWGIALYFFSIKKVPALIVSGIVISLVCKYIFISNGWACLDVFTNFDTFAFGAIPAFLLIKWKNTFECVITNIKLLYRVGIILLTVSAVLFAHYLPADEYLNEMLLSVFFCIFFASVIAIVVPQKNEIKIGQKNTFSKLGKYTYGLYLYHIIIISLFIQLFARFTIGFHSLFGSLLFFVLSLSIVLLISIISYNVFEVKFLKIKERFHSFRKILK